MTESNKSTDKSEWFDLPLLILSGTVLAFMIVGALFISLGACFEAPEGSIFDLKYFISGLFDIGVSLILIGFMALYWKFILKKRGFVYPEYTFFGFLGAFMALAGGALTAIMTGDAFVT